MNRPAAAKFHDVQPDDSLPAAASEVLANCDGRFEMEVADGKTMERRRATSRGCVRSREWSCVTARDSRREIAAVVGNRFSGGHEIGLLNQRTENTIVASI
jgi:hypothetical protein